jgi:subtilase family serine protease
MKHQQTQYLIKALSQATAILLVAVSLKAAQTVALKSLPGHVPAVVFHLQPLGQLDATTNLRLSINLPLRNQDALSQLIAQIYDPASPSYHHYLTPDEFSARFGPTEQDYAAVMAFATDHRFKIVGQHPDRLLLQVSAAVPDIESAFQVKLQTYQHPTENRTFHAPDRDPSVAADVPISSIGGLDNYSRPHPTQLLHSHVPADTHRKNVVGSGPDGLLAGADFRAAYTPGISLQGSGQYVGLVEFDAYYSTDPALYASQTGLTNVPQTILLLDGFDGQVPSNDNGNNEEVALDIEMAMAMAPALAGIVVYEADPDNGLMSDVLHDMSTNTTIRQFSSSWSEPAIASEQTNINTYLAKMATQGQTFFCASGDSGAYENGVEINAPIDDPYVTSVGGTTLLTAGPTGAWMGETAWNPGYGPGSGTSGGVSTTYPIPLWQKTVSMAANGGSTTSRNVPDVAMVADNIFIVADDGANENVAGTSAASPLWAAFTALVNEQATNNKVAPVGFLNPTLYHIGTNSAYTTCLDDVISGNNTNGNTKQYFAVTGYDLCTGWGSANGSSLLVALVQPDGFQITPGRGPVGNGPAGGPFSTSTRTFVLTNNGSAAFNWALGCDAAWLNLSSTSGALSTAGAATSVTATVNSAADSLTNGVYTADLSFTNLTSGLTQVRQFTLQIGQNLVQDGSFESGDFCYWTISGSDEGIFYNDFVDNGNYTSYNPEDGDYFGAMGQTNTLAFFSQTLPTYPGQVYQLSFWLADPSSDYGNIPNQFQVQWNTNSGTSSILFNQVNMGTFDWSNMVFNVVSTTTNTTLRFGFRNDNNFFGFDNVSLTPLAGPAFQSVTPVSGGVQFSWSAITGLSYQVQYKTNLTQTSWVNLGSAVKATAAQMTTTDTSATGAGRYYRIVAP